MVFADDAARFGPALDAVEAEVGDVRPVVASGDRAGAVGLDELSATEPGPEARRAFDAITPDTVAKILFTSGSTGTPKGVLTTHRMLASNQQMMREAWPFLAVEPPVLVDWLPWSHTFGGSHNVNLVLTNGGTLHIDAGRPAPDLFEHTVEALREIAPTLYVNVPAGRLRDARPAAGGRRGVRPALLLAAAAAVLRRRVAAAGAVGPAGAAGRAVLRPPGPVDVVLGDDRDRAGGHLGALAGSRCGCIGVPLPGVTLKLVPVGDKREIRLRGDNITPGYLHRPDATAAAFDDEGFYRTGDAVVLVDPDDPNQGLMFDGRIAEDFKLTTGTWVSVATVRTNLISTARVLSDAVLAGHDRDEVTALAWLNLPEARVVCGLAAESDVPLDHPALREHLTAALAEAGAGAGSAGRVARLLLCAEPPDLDAGEITDKGYLNQAVVLDRRADLVERLYADEPDEAIIAPAPSRAG